MTTIAEITKTMQGKMDQSIVAFKNNLQKIRTGRANPALLDTVHVEYYGSMVPLSQVANVALLDSRTISVQPWEKGMGAKIEKAIRESDLGLNPASMGDLIRVPMPPMSEERRKEMTKLARNEGESAKIAVRNLGIMDATAFALCRDQKLPVKVFSIFKPGALKRVVMGEDEGTLVYA